MPDTPTLTAVVCTRDRGALISDTLRSILASDADAFELLVVDQSADRSVEDALDALAGPGTTVRYARTTTRGLSHARNVGLQLARAPIVAMTDDDCIVDRSWIREIREAFAARPHVTLLFGNVEAAANVRPDTFIPAYERRDTVLARRLADKHKVEGMGACMAMRRDVVLNLGGFDPQLGAGGPFHGGEEVDLTLRVLAAGQWVYETPSVRVVHHGVRSLDDAAACVGAYWFGAGAAMGKHLRRHPWRSMPLFARLGARFLFSQSLVAKSLGSAAMPRRQLMEFLGGVATGARASADKA